MMSFLFDDVDSPVVALQTEAQNVLLRLLSIPSFLSIRLEFLGALRIRVLLRTSCSARLPSSLDFLQLFHGLVGNSLPPQAAIGHHILVAASREITSVATDINIVTVGGFTSTDVEKYEHPGDLFGNSNTNSISPFHYLGLRASLTTRQATRHQATVLSAAPNLPIIHLYIQTDRQISTYKKRAGLPTHLPKTASRLLSESFDSLAPYIVRKGSYDGTPFPTNAQDFYKHNQINSIQDDPNL